MRQHLILYALLGMLMLKTTATVLAASEVVDRIVAVVNEEIILLTELNKRIEPYVQRIRQQGFDQDKEHRTIFQMREEMLNRLVDEKLTDQEIKRNDIQVDEVEIDRTIERIKSANYFTDEDLRLYLEQDQQTMETYRTSIKEQILRTRLVNYQVKSKIVITEEEIQAYYDSHPEQYGGKIRYHLRNILIRIPEFSTNEEKQALEEKMEKILEQLGAGVSFAEVAQSSSQSPAAKSGGDIGEFDKESLSPQIQTALDGLDPSQYTAVLDTDLGYQIFYLEGKKRAEGKPLETVRDEIHQKLFAEVVDKKFLTWLEELRSQSHIKIIN